MRKKVKYMSIFIEILRYLVEILGTAMLTIVLVYGGSAFINYIKRLVNKQTRIKFLCGHEYVLDWKWPTFTDSIVYRFRCKKCGKVQKIRAYEKEEGGVHEI